MKKRMKQMAMVIGAAAMAFSAAPVSADDVESVTVTIPTVYDLPDADLVEEEINKITEEKYGIHFNFEFVTAGNWQQQSNLLFTGDETDIIAAFMTPLRTYVNNGQVADLTDYYNNASDEFKAIWSEEEMAGTMVDGKIYAVPNLRNFGNIFGLNIDSDIAAEFGIENGQTMTFEDIDEFLTQAHEKYPDRYALVPQSSSTMIAEWSWDGLGDANFIGVLPDCGQDTTVQNLFETDDFTDFCTWTNKWYKEGLIMQDILSNTQPFQTLIGNDQAIACFDNYSVNNVAGITRTVVIENWAQSNSYQALCYVINQNSSKQDAAWKAMEILYVDADVETLLTDGIEGTHYTKNDDGTISFVDGKSAADCGYGMAEGYWITPYSGKTLPLDVNGATFFDDLLQFNKDSLKTKAFGFSFDTSVVADQYTACTNVKAKYYDALIGGAVDDLDATLEQANEEFYAAGLQDIIDAKQEQLDAFLAEQQ